MKLYQHQLECRSAIEQSIYIDKEPGYALCHEMGLGKTITTLDFLIRAVTKDPGFTVLVVTPTLGVLHQWIEHLQRFWPHCSHFIQAYHGNRRAMDPDVPFHVVTRGTLVSDFSHERGDVMSTHWSCVVWDEAHEYANLVTQFQTDKGPLYSRMVQRLSRSFNLLVTGTPYKNDPSDIKSMMMLMGFTISPCMPVKELAAIWLGHSHRRTTDDVHDSLPHVTESLKRLLYATDEETEHSNALLARVTTLSKHLGALLRNGGDTALTKVLLAQARSKARMYSLVLVESKKEFEEERLYDEMFYTKALLNPKIAYVMDLVKANPSRKIVVASDYTCPLHVQFFSFSILLFYPLFLLLYNFVSCL
jgi:superfamily II DNA or RNA helicase